MKLLITREIPISGIKMLNLYPQIELRYLKGVPLTNKQLFEEVKDVDGLICVIPDRITKEIIESAKKLKIISTYSVGYDHIDIDTATKKGIYVSNTPGDLTQSVAEFSLALLVALSKNIVPSDKFCRENKYKFWEPMSFIGQKLKGKKLGIVGFGRIGQQFARICKYGLEMEIYYSDPQSHFEAEKLLDAKKVDLETLLGIVDIVSLHCNLNESTHHLINENQFKLMKPDALLINTSRGAVVNEKALIKALQNNIIAGAGLDVFEDEPTINSELKNLNNVVLTSHIASSTLEARIEMSNMAVSNIIDVLIKNVPPKDLVNIELLNSNLTITTLV